MKKQRKSAFTIVELVIVIAVVAILSAVLIPTFGSIIKSANVSSDEQLASSMTKELHVWLKGETIDDEGELMTALKGSKIDEKLVPKSAENGYHFWFNMETQSIVLMTSEDYMSGNIVDVPEGSEGEETRLPSGPALMSATLINNTKRETANISFRDILGIGVFLIDQGGSDLADALNYVDDHVNDHTAEARNVYGNIVAKFTSISEDRHAKDFVGEVVEKLDKTTIVGETGHHFTNNESENIYISATATSIGIQYYNNGQVQDKAQAPGFEKPVEIPSNITSAPSNSFVHDVDKNGNPTEVILSPSQTGVFDAGAFGNNDNNKVEEATTQVIVDGKVHAPNSAGNLGAIEEDEDGNQKISEVDVIVLTFKLPFLEYKASFVATKNNSGEVLVSNDKIYVAQRLGGLRLHAVNIHNIVEYSQSVDSWEVLSEEDGSIGKVYIDPVTGVLDLTTAEYRMVNGREVCEVKVKSIAHNKKNEVVENTVTVVIVKAVTASITIGKQTVSTTGTDKDITLRFNGQHTSYAVVANATYSGDSEGKAPLQPKAKLDATELDGLRYEGNKLTFQTNDDGTLVEGFNFWFTAVVDGIITKFVDVSVVDETQAAVKLNYNKLGHADAPDYYIGTNPDGTNTTLKLSELFKISNSEKFGSKVKVTIYAYAESTGYLSPRSELNKVAKANPNQYTLTATYDNEVTTAEWATSTITFKGNIKTAKSVFIEIAPENEVSTVVEVQIVNNAINVVKGTSVDTFAKDLSTSVVLHSDVTLATGKRINLGSNSLYGNGWIITATGWKSNKTDKNDLTDALVSVNGGTVDNVYIDGPVYGTLDYADNTNKYYVSGIRAEGASTISNSYVSGFRQPVMAAGTKLDVTNTTLRGGNYANLVLYSGVLNLTDITTIQDVNGMTPTVDTDKYTTPVMGMGIAIDGNAISNEDSKINLYGYLDQYNWAKYRTSSDSAISMPVIDGLDTGDLFKCIFEGVKMNLGVTVHAEMGSVKYFIHKDKNASSGYGQYVNTGIVFVELTQAAENLNIQQSFVNDQRTSENNVTKRTMKLLDMPFDGTGLDLKVVKITAKTYLGTYGRFVAWSYQDGRQWVANDIKVENWGTKYSRLVTCSNETTDYIISDAPVSGITTKTPLTYKDYYSTGAYTNAYK